MHVSLVPCAICQRHVRANDRTCPFCEATLTAPTNAAIRDVPHGLPRAAVFALGASLALSACASTAVGRGDAADAVTADDGDTTVPDVGPPIDVARADAIDTPPAMDVAIDDVAAPLDVADATDSDTTDVVSEDSGIFPLYGAPPLPDGWDH